MVIKICTLHCNSLYSGKITPAWAEKKKMGRQERVKESSLQRCKLKILVEMVKPFGCMCKAFLCIAGAYILLCKLSYDYHNQARFHQYLQNGVLFSCKI